MIEITPFLDQNREVPLYFQLYEYIKHEIQAGKIKPGVQLPSKRKLSIYLGISQNTIETAYQQLSAEGYVESKPRKGIFVNTIDNERFSIMDPNPSINICCKEDEKEQYQIDFSHGTIALEHFPYLVWRKLTVQSLYADQNLLFLNGNPKGEFALRQEIAKYLYQSRAVRCDPEQIIIGAGTQYLISIVTMLLGRHLVYSIEEPGFHRTRAVFKDQEVVLKTIPVDKDGMNINLLKTSAANVTYVTPSHQFPLGIVMPIARRMELLGWAYENNSYIIEDDYDGEFRYKGKPIPSLQGLDDRGRVIYLGTFSKSFIPSLRTSYLVLPNKLIDTFDKHLTIYKQTVSRLHQHTLYEFMKNGHWERHLNKMRTIYRKKQKALLAAINKHLGTKVTIIGEDSGLHILLRVQNDLSEEELIVRAKEKQIIVYPTSVYFSGDTDQIPLILLGFGGLSELEIDRGLQLLNEAWFT
jgi:GntR family transcriptional regulator/MocR family aminotransferase